VEQKEAFQKHLRRELAAEEVGLLGVERQVLVLRLRLLLQLRLLPLLLAFPDRLFS